MRTPDVRRVGALLFDFDHTLADLGRWVDWQAARAGIRALYERVGLDVGDILRGARQGHSPMAVLDGALEARVPPAVAAGIKAEAYRILEDVEYAGAARAALLPGAAAAVRAAAAAGLRLGIVTANAERAVRRVLERTALAAAFETVVGRTVALPLKPAPDMFVEALRRLGVAPAAAIAVGDSPGDAEGAAAAGILPIGVLGGEAGERRLFDAGAVWVMADLRALPALLDFWHREGDSQAGSADLSD